MTSNLGLEKVVVEGESGNVTPDRRVRLNKCRVAKKSWCPGEGALPCLRLRDEHGRAQQAGLAMPCQGVFIYSTGSHRGASAGRAFGCSVWMPVPLFVSASPPARVPKPPSGPRELTQRGHGPSVLGSLQETPQP